MTKSKTSGKKAFGKTNLNGKENYEELTYKNKEFLANLVTSNVRDSSFCEILAGLRVSKKFFN